MMNRIEIPPRTWLFQVPPLGTGSGQVESLASLVARVAREHFHRPSGLLHRGLEWHARGEPQNVGRWLRSTKNLKLGSAINGHLIARRWIDVLEKQMGVPGLQETTIVKWAHLFPKVRLLRHTHCWCPECHQSGEKYDRLIWTLAPVTACPVHECRLVHACPSCGGQFAPLHARSRPGICPKCDASLFEVLPMQLQPATSDELWVAREMERFHREMQRAEVPDAAVDMAKVLTSCMAAAEIEDCAVVARAAGVSRITVWYWRSGRAKPDLENCLRMAHVFGLSLADIFLGRIPARLTIMGHAETKRHYPRRRARRFVEQTTLLQIANIRREHSSNPPSLAEVARQVGFSQRVIRNHFPELCCDISQAHIAACRTKVAERKQALRDEIRTALAQCRRPTLKELGAHMSKPGVLRSPKARSMVEQLMLELPDR